jgi:hypothetical protein
VKPRRQKNTRLQFATALSLGFLLGGACSRDTLEDELDGTPYCRAHCDLRLECAWIDGAEESTCFDQCMEDPAADGWDGECNTLLADYYDCTNVLTCDELALDQPDGVPASDRPCDEPRNKFSVCLAQHDH